MPLFKIPNQPLFPDENNPTDELCSADYCHLVASDDPIYAQWHQTPCGINEACDPDFTDVGFSNIKTSDFTSVCPDGWTLTFGWSCSGSGFGLENAGAAITCTADLLTAGLTLNSLYRVTLTISNRTQGAVTVSLGNGGTLGTASTVSDNDTYTFYLRCLDALPANDYVRIYGTGTFDGYVEYISIEEVTYTCWNDGSGTWQIDGTGGACKTDTTLSGDLDDGAGGNYLTAGNYYKLEVVISGYTSGTLTPKVGGTSGDVIEGNGTFTRYIVAGASTYVAFTPSTDFIGCVESIDIRELKYTGDYTVTIIDADSLAEIEDVSTYVTFYNEYVTLCVRPSEITLGEGCYRIYIYDTCDLQYGEYLLNPSLSGGGTPDTWNTAPNWYVTAGGGGGGVYYGASAQGDWSSGSSLDISYSGLFLQVVLPFWGSEKVSDFVAGNYRLSITILNNSDPTNIGVDIYTGAQTPASTPFSTVGTHFYDIAYDPNSSSLDGVQQGRILIRGNFNLLGVPTNGNIEIGAVSLTRLAPYEATYVSDCFKVVADASRTKLLIGTCDTEQFGFEFANSGFKLLHRVECRGFNPSWTMSQDDYTFSTGSTERNYAEIEKFWELFIEACPATTHGTIALQINCDNFEIGDTETDTKTYITSPGDYTPEWDRTGASDIAPARLQLKIKSEGMLFNRKC